ncbi:MAG: hypothetical protein QW701_03030 [Candidatus Nezhaarchaeales archaeon]
MPHTMFTEIMLTVVVASIAAFLAAAFYSNISSFYDIYRATIDSEKDKMVTNIKIIYATNTSSTTAKLWVKNIGQRAIHSNILTKSTLIFGPVAECYLVNYNASNPPLWGFYLVSDFDSDGVWDPSETIEILVVWGEPLPLGDYYAKLILYNGVSDEYYFSI